MSQNYNYPLNTDWSTEEMVQVIQLFNAVEQAYEKGIHLDEFKKAYQEFKKIVTSKSEEKQLGNKFEQISGYSIYRTVQEANRKSQEKGNSKRAQIITMNKK